jgi:hypothetical protein
MRTEGADGAATVAGLDGPDMWLNLKRTLLGWPSMIQPDPL